MRSISQILGGDWAMDPDALALFVDTIRAAAVSEPPAITPPANLEPITSKPAGSVAVVKLHGPVMRARPSWFDFFGIAAIGAKEASEVIEALAADPNISGILLDVDSPGGQVAGTDALASAIAGARESTRVVAFVSGQAESAAYWFASQAEEIHAARTSSAGSIGVYATIYDRSKSFEDSGIKVHTVASGPRKGALNPGSEITAEDLAEVQTRVDGLAKIFIGAVAEGRGVTPAEIEHFATGESWLAEQARDFGLIDQVGTFEDALAALTSQEGIEEKMKEEATAPAAAVPQAAAPVDVSALAGKIDALQAELADAKAQAENAELEANTAKGALRAYRDEQKAAIVAKGQGEGRIAPEQLDSVNAFAESCGEDVAKLQAFVDVLPVVIKKDPETSTEPAASKLSAEQADFAKAYGMTPEEFALGVEE